MPDATGDTSLSRPGADNSPEVTPPCAAVIYNPIKVDIEVLREVVTQAQKSAGWKPSLWLETTEDDAGEGVGKQAIDNSVNLVIVAGGDGTVRAVADALRGSDTPLAMVPSGTGNLLARNLDLTLDDLQHSINVAFTGVNRNIDIAVIDIEREEGSTDRHAFLVMAGVGLDAKMIANTDSELKARVGWMAYIQGITRALRDESQLRLRYTLDSTAARDVRAHTLIIGNCGSLPANMLLLPDAVVDDGIFDIVLLRPKGFFGWLQVWLKIAWENGVIRRTRAGRRLAGEQKDIRALHYDTGTSLTATFSKSEAIELDGDDFGKTIKFKSWIEPKGITIRVPAATDADEGRLERIKETLGLESKT